MIKAIETVYNGYRFRSRLEARWAVFFDALNVPYEYEPEGFWTPYGGYLPDFRVKCYGNRGSCYSDPYDLYIEVKGNMTQDDAEKITAFANLRWDDYGIVENPVLIVGNIPPAGCSTDGYSLGAYEKMNGIDIYPFNYRFIDGDYFAAYPAATSDGRFYLFGDDSNYIVGADRDRVENAYRIARQARFEHGEKPVI